MQRLGPESMGLIGLFSVFQSLVALLDAGLSTTIMQEMADVVAQERLSRRHASVLYGVETLALLFVGVMTLSGAVLLPIALNFWRDIQELPRATVLFTLFLILIASGLRVFDGIYRGAMYARHQQYLYNALSALLVSIRYGVGIYLVTKLNSNVADLIFSVALTYLAGIAIFHLLIHSRQEKYVADAGEIIRLATDSARAIGGISVVAALSVLFLQCDKVLLSFTVPLSSLGIYSLASTGAGVLFILVIPATQAWFPELALGCAEQDANRIKRAYSTMMKSVIWLVAPPCLILCLDPENILTLWSGGLNDSAQLAAILRVLALGNLINILAYMPYQLLLAGGNARRMRPIYMIIIPISALATVASSARWGAIGAAWTWVAMNAVLLIFSTKSLAKVDSHGCAWNRKTAGMVFSIPIAYAIMACMESMVPLKSEGRLEALSNVAIEYAVAAIIVPITMRYLPRWPMEMKW
jgi:O-antigen/teichoic acid export membrane protein